MDADAVLDDFTQLQLGFEAQWPSLDAGDVAGAAEDDESFNDVGVGSEMHMEVEDEGEGDDHQLDADSEAADGLGAAVVLGPCPLHCLDRFSGEEQLRVAASFKKMGQDERRAVMTGLLSSGMMSRPALIDIAASAVADAADADEPPVRRMVATYRLFNQVMCRLCFLKLTGVSHYVIDAVSSQLRLEPYTVTVKSSSRRGRADLKDIGRQVIVRKFLALYADEFSYPSPSGSVKCKNGECGLYLPSSTLKLDMFKKMKSEMDHASSLEYSWFCKIWKQHFPHLRIAKPGSDFCEMCERPVKDDGILFHRAMADAQRKSYVACIEESRVSLEAAAYTVVNCAGRPHRSVAATLHVCLDYAQDVLLPRSTRQVKEMFFLTGYRVSLFGICVPALHVQYCFLIPESIAAIFSAKPSAKTVNHVISQLDHFLNALCTGVSRLIIHADNCVAQNKNSMMLGYLSWRVACKLQNAIELRFMERGHTKFAPDAMFGVLKRAVFRNNVETFTDLKSLAVTSAHCLRVIDGTKIIWRDWAAFMKQFYGNLIGVTQYHRFQFLDGHEGIVTSQYDSSPTSEKSILLPDITAAVVQNPVRAGLKEISEFVHVPMRMDAARKKFLVEKVAHHVTELQRATFIAELDLGSVDDGGAEAVEEDEDEDTSESVSETSESENAPEPKRRRMPRGRRRGRGRGRGVEGGRRGRPKR